MVYCVQPSYRHFATVDAIQCKLFFMYSLSLSFLFGRLSLSLSLDAQIRTFSIRFSSHCTRFLSILRSSARSITLLLLIFLSFLLHTCAMQEKFTWFTHSEAPWYFCCEFTALTDVLILSHKRMPFTLNPYYEPTEIALTHVHLTFNALSLSLTLFMVQSVHIYNIRLYRSFFEEFSAN